MSCADCFEVYAIKYATRSARSGENFHGHPDPHEDEHMPMDYYIWVARSDQHTVVIDVGFNEQVAKQRNRTFLRCPVDTLQQFGINVNEVPYVIITHMHYDHIGNLRKFPKSTFVVQEAEMSFWTGKYAARRAFHSVVEEDDILHLVKENFKARVKFVQGTKELVPGIQVHKVGGHSAGLQVVTVNTKTGRLVLASDATHYYRNIREDRPFSVVYNIAEMYDAFDIVNELADAPDLIIPGHDPQVMERFPGVGGEFNGRMVKLA